jgi:hypothetical protein
VLVDVKALIERNLVTGMRLDIKTAPDPICEPCLAGKMRANPFPSSSWRASRPLELVHSDAHEVPYRSFSGFRYWVTFIDNYSRFRFVLPSRAKSDVFAAFKQFKAFAENQTERKIKTLRDDKGWKFYNPTTKRTVISERTDFDEQPPVVAALTPTSVPAVPYIAPDLPSDADDDEEIPAAEMPPPQGDLDDEDAEEPAPLPPAPLPPAPPATPPPAPARAPSPVGIGARMPARNCQPPREWWKLSPAQLVGNPDDSDDDEADIAQCLASSSTHPRSFADALRRTDAPEWRKAALTELDAHKTNGTWIRPVIGSR